jgi:endonuclease-8
VGEAILDQRNLAGVGNLYKSELCFLLGLHPRSPVGEVPDVRALVRRAKQVLEANKLRTAQTTTGDTRRGRQVWVYRRDGQPCRRCGTPVEVAMQGSETRERATYWCPRCQPER